MTRLHLERVAVLLVLVLAAAVTRDIVWMLAQLDAAMRSVPS